jgi:hypothetical protein
LADRWPAHIAAAVLRRGAMVHAVSAALTVGGIALTVVSRSLWPVGGAVVAIGLVEFWLAARVAIDADLFAALGEDDLAQFDEAMRRLGLMPGSKADRPMEARIRGALRLLKLQVALLLLQIAALFAGSILLR